MAPARTGTTSREPQKLKVLPGYDCSLHICPSTHPLFSWKKRPTLCTSPLVNFLVILFHRTSNDSLEQNAFNTHDGHSPDPSQHSLSLGIRDTTMIKETQTAKYVHIDRKILSEGPVVLCLASASMYCFACSFLVSAIKMSWEMCILTINRSQQSTSEHLFTSIRSLSIASGQLHLQELFSLETEGAPSCDRLKAQQQSVSSIGNPNRKGPSLLNPEGTIFPKCLLSPRDLNTFRAIHKIW